MISFEKERILIGLKKYPLALGCLFLALVCGAVVFLRGDRLVQLTEQESELAGRMRVIEQNAKNSVALEEHLNELKAAVNRIESKRFKREERAVNINFFYDLEDRFDVRISEIRQSPSDYAFYERGGIHELKSNSTIVFNISLNGKFSDLIAVVQQISLEEPIMRVSNFQVAAGNRNAQAGQLESRLQVVVLAEKD